LAQRLQRDRSTPNRRLSEQAPHRPVMVDRVVELLRPALSHPGAVFVDATLGAGGHSQAILTAARQARLIGIDRDEQALALASKRLKAFADRVQLVHGNFADLTKALGTTPVDAVLFDLGLSSMQIDQPERGFAYALDAELDMRMDRRQDFSAAELLASASLDELTRILRTYGEEPNARRIAAAIVRHRQNQPIRRTGELVDLVRQAIPAPAKRHGGNPAKRTFQALRMAVNQELSALQSALPAALQQLAPGGRLIVLSYHSGEDRIAKRIIKTAATPVWLPDLPVEPPVPALRWLTRGGERPCAAELDGNPRSASARLRAVERTLGHLVIDTAAASRRTTPILDLPCLAPDLHEYTQAPETADPILTAPTNQPADWSNQ
jgi:16S rRNA (cytosine1402-N4)-methyltransferase